MIRPSRLWVLALVSASCAVNGFSIVDELPGGGGASAGHASGGSLSGSGGDASETAGSDTRGGRAGAAGGPSQGGVPSAGAAAEAGAPTAAAGEAGTGGDGGEGSAPIEDLKPCDQSKGVPPLFCDDFESGTFLPVKWSPPAGLGVTTDEGPHGPTKLVRLEGAELRASVNDFPVTAAGAQVTLSFWMRALTPAASPALLSLRDRSAAATSLRLGLVQSELGWRSATSNFSVPEAPTQAMLKIGSWTCVSILFTNSTMVLKYQAKGAVGVNTVVIDEVATTGVDKNWQQLTFENRYAAGYPAFGSTANGVASHLWLDDVRISTDSSSICAF